MVGSFSQRAEEMRRIGRRERAFPFGRRLVIVGGFVEEDVVVLVRVLFRRGLLLRRLQTQPTGEYDQEPRGSFRFGAGRQRQRCGGLSGPFAQKDVGSVAVRSEEIARR